MISISGQSSISVVAQLGKNKRALNQAIERLSSGQKINSAKDDAAGQSIGNRMTAQVRGQRQAARNANDGISMALTAEGSLSQINDRLQRVRELTVQGINGTLNLSDTDVIQQEINQNLKEIDRLNEQAKFNGINLLDGSAGKLDIQVGANDADTLPLDLAPPGFSVEALGLKDFTIAGLTEPVTPLKVVTGTAFNIPVVDPDTTLRFDNLALGDPLLVESNTPGYQSGRYTLDQSTGQVYESRVVATPSHDTASGDNRVDVSVGNALYADVEQVDGIDIDSATVSYQNSAGDEFDNGRLVATGAQYFIEHDTGAGLEYFAADVTTTPPDEITARARASTGLQPPSFTPVESVNGESTITLDPRNVTVNYTDHEGNRFEDALRQDDEGNYFLKASAGDGDTPGYRSATLVESESMGTLLKTRRGSGDLVIYYQMRQDSATTDVPADQSLVELREVDPEIRIKDPLDPLATLDRAIARIDAKRGQLGATQNRLASAVEQQGEMSRNLVAARSRILDADYAQEASRVTQTQILQQAGTAVLVQANQSLDSVLALLE